MILLHNFKIDLLSYSQKAKNNEFPVLTQCPSCNKHHCLKKHGFYLRYAINAPLTEKIPICRYKCYSCQITISILPSFLIPYFQHSVLFVASTIYHKLLKKKSPHISRQLVTFYLKRFNSQLAWISSCLLSFQESTKDNHINSPLRILKLIYSLGINHFNLASFGYQLSYFMSSQPLLSP
jgi:hypothetical protein